MREWEENMCTKKGIQLKNGSTIEKALYADDEVLVNKSEDRLQIAPHQLNNITRLYNLKIYTSKTKSKGKCINEIRRLKTVIEGKIIEQFKKFNYLGNKILKYKNDMEYNYKHTTESMKNEKNGE